MIPIQHLSEPESVAIPAILARAISVEGIRTNRTLGVSDVIMFLAAVRKYPGSRVRVFANRGDYANLNQKTDHTMTVIEYTPADGYGPAQACVSECDARRPHKRGPWVEVDGRREA